MPDAPIMTLEQRSFAEFARSATLATIGTSGRPRLVPVCHVLGADDRGSHPRLYSPLDEKPKRSSDPRDLARVRDLLVLPEASLLIDRWSEDWSRLGWLRLDCHGEMLEPEPREREEHRQAIGALRAKYPQYAAQRLEDRPILRFTVHRAVSWGNLSVMAGHPG
jgi:PPOX class probable F420-dependent enzyme